VLGEIDIAGSDENAAERLVIEKIGDKMSQIQREGLVWFGLVWFGLVWFGE
jgi:hypothetical protein